MNQNKCPSCGASAIQSNNCEYCGSFLVRFKGSDQNISEKIDQYKSSVHTEFPEIHKLIENIIKKQDKISGYRPLSIIDTGLSDVTMNIGDNESIFQIVETKSGVALEIYFKENNENLRSFRGMSDFWLFKDHNDYDYNSAKGYPLSYEIDFGGDIDNATRVVSEFLKKVCGKTANDFIEYENFDETENAGIKDHKGVNYSDGDDDDDDEEKTGCFRTIFNWVGSLMFFYVIYELIF